VLQFTGSTRGFNYGLYFRNINGNAHQGWAKFGLNDGGTTLSLAPGHYSLKYKICNWNMPDFGTVELSIEHRTGSTSIASQTYTPDINIGNVASNNFASPSQQSFEFDVAEQGDYVIAFYSAASGWSDCIIGQLALIADSYATDGIDTMRYEQEKTNRDHAIYDLQGRKVSLPQKGIYIKNGKKFIEN
jgi:hypothetical protein